MVRGHGPSPGHDTWCGPGATPMIAQSPADSPGMPGQWVESRPCRRPGPHARADRRPPRGAPRPRPPRPRRSPRGTLPSGLRPCRRPQIRFTPSVRVISSRAPTTTSTRPISRATSPPGTTSPASRRSRRWVMGRPGPRYGEPLFGRTYDLLPACLARRAGRSEHTRKSRERGLGALNDCVTGELGIEPTPLTFAMCRYDPPARLVSAHAGGWPRERDRKLAVRDGESPSAPRR